MSCLDRLKMRMKNCLNFYAGTSNDAPNKMKK